VHEGNELPLGISIGVATLSPEDETLVDLIRRADRGTYASKAAGGHRVSLAHA
jgi:PleD family two-component response regulator